MYAPCDLHKMGGSSFRGNCGTDVFTLQDARDVARNREVEHEMGISLSMHSEVAVESMTCRPFASTSM